MIEIIAECGVNHNGDLELAKDLILAAKEAGANTVKFQLFDVEALVRTKAPLANYQRERGNKAKNQNDLLQKLSLSADQHLKIIEFCSKEDINYLTSVFDMKSLKSASHILNQKRIKLGSGELTNYQLIRGAIEKDLSIILSTGMSNLYDISDVLRFISFSLEKPNTLATKDQLLNYNLNSKIINEKVSILHCTSQYPTPLDSINLNNIHTIKNIFSGCVGLSDHSEGFFAAVASVGMGIKILEKHFTLSKSLIGPDHKASMEPVEFARMVTAVRDAETAMGEMSKEILIIEKDVALIAKKSLVASQSIKKGEKFSEENLTVKRPGTGVSAKYYFDYLERISTKEYKFDDFIEE